MAGPNLRAKLSGIIAVALVTAITLLLAEAGYRFFLWQSLTREGAPPAYEDRFGFYNYPAAPWQFDRALGFRYTEGQWLAGAVIDGKFAGCNTEASGNKYGNVSRVWGDYETADVKILMFGSSFTMYDPYWSGERTISNLLAQRLSETLGKKVVVLNFSRDATGILSMFDIAAASVDTYKPDLMLFTFNSSAFAHQRRWRVVREVRPNFYRLHETLDPDRLDDPRTTTIIPTVVTPLVTHEWCQEMLAARERKDEDRLRNDPVVKAMLEEHALMMRERSRPIIAVDFLTLKRSFIYNGLRRRNPFHGLQPIAAQTVYAPFKLPSFGDDPVFAQRLSKVLDTKVPFLLVNVPTLDELKLRQPVFGRYGNDEEGDRRLAKSLTDLTGRPIIPLVDYYTPEQLRDPLLLVQSEADSHPSILGNETMAAALAALLLKSPETASRLQVKTGEASMPR